MSQLPRAQYLVYSSPTRATRRRGPGRRGILAKSAAAWAKTWRIRPRVSPRPVFSSSASRAVHWARQASAAPGTASQGRVWWVRRSSRSP